MFILAPPSFPLAYLVPIICRGSLSSFILSFILLSNILVRHLCLSLYHTLNLSPTFGIKPHLSHISNTTPTLTMEGFFRPFLSSKLLGNPHCMHRKVVDTLERASSHVNPAKANSRTQCSTVACQILSNHPAYVSIENRG